MMQRRISESECLQLARKLSNASELPGSCQVYLSQVRKRLSQDEKARELKKNCTLR